MGQPLRVAPASSSNRFSSSGCSVNICWYKREEEKRGGERGASSSEPFRGLFPPPSAGPVLLSAFPAHPAPGESGRGGGRAVAAPRLEGRGSGSSGGCVARPERVDSPGSRRSWRRVVRARPAARASCAPRGQPCTHKEGLGATAPAGPGLSLALWRLAKGSRAGGQSGGRDRAGALCASRRGVARGRRGGPGRRF